MGNIAITFGFRGTVSKLFLVHAQQIYGMRVILRTHQLFITSHSSQLVRQVCFGLDVHRAGTAELIQRQFSPSGETGTATINAVVSTNASIAATVLGADDCCRWVEIAMRS